jgi:hypothetical protein
MDVSRSVWPNWRVTHSWASIEGVLDTERSLRTIAGKEAS